MMPTASIMVPSWASPHFSHSMWPAPVQEADRAGAARRAMWDIGQARRRTLSASSTGPLGCLSAGISSVGRLNRMPRYAFRRPTLYLPRRKSNAGRMECEKCGLGLHQPVKRGDEPVDVALIVVDVRADAHAADARRHVDVFGGEFLDQPMRHSASEAEAQNVRRSHPRVEHVHR